MKQPSRRTFCVSGAAAVALLRDAKGQTRQATHPDVAAIDHDRIVATAGEALTRPVETITALVAARSAGTLHDFYSEPEDFHADPASTSGAWVRKPGTVNAEAFTAHRDAVYAFGVTVAALTAAWTVTSEARYAEKAAEHLRAWFVAPASKMNPTLQFAQRVPGAAAGRPEGVIESLPLAEVARSVRFLEPSEALSAEELAAVRKWFADYLQWLNESRMAGLARDSKDHHGSSWLMQAAAYADSNVVGLTSDDSGLNALRHRFHTATLRAQMDANGKFPREVATPTPYRNALLNLDLLTVACELLTTRFDNPWEYELQDGPGLRAAIAYHFPYIQTPATWPYPADASHFKELPGRRISLLLAGRAYTQPSYVDLWKALSPLPKTAPPELLRTFPVSQPLLWATRIKPLQRVTSS